MKTNKTFTHFIFCLLSIFLIFLVVAKEQDSTSVLASEVDSPKGCAEGLVPIIKRESSELVCVKPETALKLIERNWGAESPITSTAVTSEAGTETGLAESADVGTKADMVFLSGAVYTVDESNPWAEAVAIQDGKITYVGNDAGAEDFIGEDTEIIELVGKMLLPSFHDTHAHPIDMSLTLMGCDLFEGTSKEEYLEQIEQCAEEQKDRRSLIGVGYWIGAFPEDDRPNRYDLDKIVPDQPVWLMDLDGHSFWINSRTLELSNIDKDTPDPEGGIIERDENGEPTGLLIGDAWLLIPEELWMLEDDENIEGAKQVFGMLNSAGVTSLVEAASFDENNYDNLYIDLFEAEVINLRVDVAMWVNPNEDDEEQVADLIRRSTRSTNPRLDFSQVKILADGYMGNNAGLLFEPYYEDGELTDNFGDEYFEQDRLNNLVTELEKAGFQIHVHVDGDKASNMALEAFEAAREVNDMGNRRHTMTHLTLVQPDDIPRLKELDIIANIQGFWGFPDVEENWIDELIAPKIGIERVNKMYPFRSIKESGAMIVASSDWPVSTHEPLPAIEVAIRRQSPFDDSPDARPLNPEEGLDLETMLAAYTINGAYFMQQEDVTGSIEVGKYADLIVLDQNLFEIPVHEISDTKVLLTLLEGEVVYNSDFHEASLETILAKANYLASANVPRICLH